MRPLTCFLLLILVVSAQSRVQRRRNTEESLLDCSRLVDGNYPNPNERCSQIFVTCDNGLLLTRNCPVDTFYDELVDDCAQKNYVRACGGQLPRQEDTNQRLGYEPAKPSGQEAGQQSPAAVVTNSPQKVVESSTVEHILFNCAGLRPGNYPNPAAKDGCSPIFFSCGAARRPHLMMCPGRTYYDDELDSCNYFSDVPKCSGVPRTTTTVGEPGSTTTVAPDPYDCTRLPDGNYAPPKEETSCPGYFYQCANRRGFRVDCPLETLRYDSVQDACVTLAEVPGCADAAY